MTQTCRALIDRMCSPGLYYWKNSIANLPSAMCSLMILIVSVASCNNTDTSKGPREYRVLALPELVSFGHRLESTRQNLGIPGLSLAVVKDDRVVYLAGHGQRELNSALPVTKDTVFAIGSMTKSFTALLVLIAVEEGKLSLDSSPKDCNADFALKDKKAEARITIRNLLTHTSGLGWTDLGWLTGRLTKEQVIQLAGSAAPVASLGEEFHYQNVMYLVAGECVANAMEATYKEIIQRRIFRPLGMEHANTSISDTVLLRDRAVGYVPFGPNKALRSLPMREVDSVTPAAGINVSAGAMAQWIRLLLGKGAVDGMRIVEEATFARLMDPYVNVGNGDAYGLGWFIGKWGDYVKVWHVGSIDGYSSLIALLPEANIGFALLTNVQKDDINGWLTDELFSLLVGSHPSDSSQRVLDSRTAMQEEIGTYGVIGGIRAAVRWNGYQLLLKLPYQPEFPLHQLAARRYRLGVPAPAGFRAEFQGESDQTELILEQPSGRTVVFKRLTARSIGAIENNDAIATELMDILGSYQLRLQPLEVEIAVHDGRVALLVPHQPAMPLVPVDNQRGTYQLDGLPSSFSVEIRRDSKGTLEGFTLTQPGSSLEFDRVVSSAIVRGPALSLEELEQKVSNAHGLNLLVNREAIRLSGRIYFMNQGVHGTVNVWRGKEGTLRKEVSLSAFDRKIGHMCLGFDGMRAWEIVDFLPGEELSGARRDAVILHARFNPYERWQQTFLSAKIVRTSRDDDEDLIVVVMQRASGVEVTEYFSRNSYLLLRRTTVVPADADSPPNSSTEIFSDYRNIGGAKIAHRIEEYQYPVGKTVTVIDRVETNAGLTNHELFGVDAGRCP